MDNVTQQAIHSAWELGYDERKRGNNVNPFDKYTEAELHDAWNQGWLTGEEELTAFRYD